MPFSAVAVVGGFCTAFDELRQYFRSRSFSQIPLPLPEQRRQFKQRFDALSAAYQVA